MQYVIITKYRLYFRKIEFFYSRLISFWSNRLSALRLRRRLIVIYIQKYYNNSYVIH